MSRLSEADSEFADLAVACYASKESSNIGGVPACFCVSTSHSEYNDQAADESTYRGIGASIARVVFFFDYDAPGRQVIYVGLLESGMAITVVNLPSIWWLFSSTVPEKIDRSLHSLCSLRSDESHTVTPPTGFGPDDGSFQPCRPVQFDGRNSSVVTSYYSGQPSYSGDVEAGTYSRKDSKEPSEIAPNAIAVEHKIEVKRTPS